MNNKLWVKNPGILFTDLNQFFPTNNLSNVEKINSLVRLSIYYSIILLIFKMDTKWFAIPIVLTTISFLLAYSDHLESFLPEKVYKINDSECKRPTHDNPFMNYTVGDLLDQDTNPIQEACPLDEIRDEQLKEFRAEMVPDPADLWGRFISDRNFYTMPNSKIVNDQKEFAEWLYGDSGLCKSEGKQCVKNTDNRLTPSRYYVSY